MDTKIFVMTHKEMNEIPDKTYLPLYVGKAGKETLGYTGDDTGDHISEKNPVYCELTGVYWLWKNMDCDVIGICHYRRYLVKEGKLLDRAYIERVIQTYPVIIPNSSYVSETDVYAHYGERHYTKDLDLCREVIGEKYPEYLPAFDYAMRTILMSVGNIWITRKDIFDRYCAWLFDILFEVEKRIDMQGYDGYQSRVMGFLAERLFRVWLFLQPEAITEEEMKMADPSGFLYREKRTELLYRYTKLKTEPIRSLYLADGGRKPSVRPLPGQDKLEGKIPVFVCWWQGEKEMPELIRHCVKRIRENFSLDRTEFCLITLENCLEYVSFTKTVIDKFNQGKISYSQLSDMLMAELLFRYGGVWIAASYFVTKPVGAKIFQREMYTLCSRDPFGETEFSENRWTSDLWYTKKEKKLFGFLMESFWNYWETEEKMTDYFVLDGIIAAAAEQFSGIKKELELCRDNADSLFELQKWMNRRYFPDRAEKLMAESLFYKLDWRKDCRKENLAGEKTLYGYLLGEQG